MEPAWSESLPTFSDSFSNTLRGSAPSNGTTSSQSGIQVGTGVQLAGIQTNYNQGALNTVYSGGDKESYLLLPIIPAK